MSRRNLTGTTTVSITQSGTSSVEQKYLPWSLVYESATNVICGIKYTWSTKSGRASSISVSFIRFDPKTATAYWTYTAGGIINSPLKIELKVTLQYYDSVGRDRYREKNIDAFDTPDRNYLSDRLLPTTLLNRSSDPLIYVPYKDDARQCFWEQYNEKELYLGDQKKVFKEVDVSSMVNAGKLLGVFKPSDNSERENELSQLYLRGIYRIGSITYNKNNDGDTLTVQIGYEGQPVTYTGADFVTGRVPKCVLLVAYGAGGGGGGGDHAWPGSGGSAAGVAVLVARLTYEKSLDVHFKPYVLSFQVGEGGKGGSGSSGTDGYGKNGNSVFIDLGDERVEVEYGCGGKQNSSSSTSSTVTGALFYNLKYDKNTDKIVPGPASKHSESLNYFTCLFSIPGGNGGAYWSQGAVPLSITSSNIDSDSYRFEPIYYHGEEVSGGDAVKTDTDLRNGKIYLVKPDNVTYTTGRNCIFFSYPYDKKGGGGPDGDNEGGGGGTPIELTVNGESYAGWGGHGGIHDRNNENGYDASGYGAGGGGAAKGKTWFSSTTGGKGAEGCVAVYAFGD